MQVLAAAGVKRAPNDTFCGVSSPDTIAVLSVVSNRPRIMTSAPAALLVAPAVSNEAAEAALDPEVLFGLRMQEVESRAKDLGQELGAVTSRCRNALQEATTITGENLVKLKRQIDEQDVVCTTAVSTGEGFVADVLGTLIRLDEHLGPLEHRIGELSSLLDTYEAASQAVLMLSSLKVEENFQARQAAAAKAASAEMGARAGASAAPVAAAAAAPAAAPASAPAVVGSSDTAAPSKKKASAAETDGAAREQGLEEEECDYDFSTPFSYDEP